jgi:hypothetical protein
MDAGVDIEFGHIGADVLAGPGVTGFGGGDAFANDGDLVGILLAAMLGEGADHGRGCDVAGAVVDRHAVAGRIDVAERHELAGTAGRRLAVVPVDGPAFVDVSQLAERLLRSS